jgi:hypothetical protein
MQKVRVKVAFFVNVEFPDHMTADEIKFVVEENGCPGTGSVGAEIERLIAEGEETSTCWACAAKGKNKIVEREC